MVMLEPMLAGGAIQSSPANITTPVVKGLSAARRTVLGCSHEGFGSGVGDGSAWFCANG
jgi:hypothetical protein